MSKPITVYLPSKHPRAVPMDVTLETESGVNMAFRVHVFAFIPKVYQLRLDNES